MRSIPELTVPSCVCNISFSFGALNFCRSLPHRMFSLPKTEVFVEKQRSSLSYRNYKLTMSDEGILSPQKRARLVTSQKDACKPSKQLSRTTLSPTSGKLSQLTRTHNLIRGLNGLVLPPPSSMMTPTTELASPTSRSCGTLHAQH